MFKDRTLLTIKIDKNDKCYVEYYKKTFPEFSELELKIINCHVLQIIDIVKDKYLKERD